MDKIQHAIPAGTDVIATKLNARRLYSQPQVLSAEDLEATAATCDPPSGSLGKTIPFPCTDVGS